MSEKIIIENFGGLKRVEFELRNINILIGPQASGKSVTVKLLYFFKNFISEMLKSIENGDSKHELDKKQKEKFNTYFPKEAWPKSAFRIQYLFGEHSITIEKHRTKSLSFNYSESYKDLLNKGRKILKDEQKKTVQDAKLSSFRVHLRFRNRLAEYIKKDIGNVANFNQYFIPAGRSFFANVQSSIFSFLSNNKSLDPFLIEFGSFYENFKRFGYDDNPSNEISKSAFNKLISEIISGKFQREKDKDYIIHDDTRKVNLSNASSGQQEMLPLALVLKTLVNIKLSNGGATLYIEEPEAHLFPTAQRKIVQLLARTFNSNNNFQIIVTTHSPYILTSFNNLIEAGKIVTQNELRSEEVHQVIPQEELIQPNEIMAYSLFNGKKKVLIDKETKLIADNELDAVSDELSVEFGKLLDIEF